MESAFYLIVYLLSKNRLPWCKNKHVDWNFNQKADHRLNDLTRMEFDALLSKELREIYQYIELLKFKEEPNYDWVLSMFNNLLDKEKRRKHCFDWQITSAY